MIYIVIISKQSGLESKTYRSLSCPFPHRLIISHAVGWGKARNAGAKASGQTGLMVQLNDDLQISPELWKFVLTVKQGEFAFQIYNEGGFSVPCSRVFIIHLEDFWRIGGCDSKLKYYFEDGEFYHRAIANGLKFRCVPTELATHTPHRHAFYNPRNWLQVEAEAAKVYVRFGQAFIPFRHISGFFFPFHDYRVAPQHFTLRVLFMVYYIIKGVLRNGELCKKNIT